MQLATTNNNSNDESLSHNHYWLLTIWDDDVLTFIVGGQGSETRSKHKVRCLLPSDSLIDLFKIRVQAKTKGCFGCKRKCFQNLHSKDDVKGWWGRGNKKKEMKRKEREGKWKKQEQANKGGGWKNKNTEPNYLSVLTPEKNFPPVIFNPRLSDPNSPTESKRDERLYQKPCQPCQPYQCCWDHSFTGTKKKKKIVFTAKIAKVGNPPIRSKLN